MASTEKPVSTLTSIHALIDVRSKFKAQADVLGITQQKLFNRAMHLYSTNPEFKRMIDGCLELTVLGTQF